MRNKALTDRISILANRATCTFEINTEVCRIRNGSGHVVWEEPYTTEGLHKLEETVETYVEAWFPESTKVHRIQVDFTDKGYKKLLALKESSGLDSITELIKQSLAAYEEKL